MLEKDGCRKKARAILQKGAISHMTESQLACELYFHAVIFHICTCFLRRGIRFAVFRNLMAHADPIDLSDYGDTLFRRFCFRLLWLLPGEKKRF